MNVEVFRMMAVIMTQWKRMILAIIAVLIAWAVMDYVIHGVILSPLYAATAQFWRPTGQIKFGLYYFTLFIAALTFVLIYSLFFLRKGTFTGFLYGILFGLSGGVLTGYGFYSFMPIPSQMAFSWFFGSLLEGIVGGLIIGAILPEPN